MEKETFMVFSGTATKYLAEKICQSLGCPLGKLQFTRFSDGEFAVCVVPIKDLAVFMTSCESDHFGFLSTVAEHCLDCTFRRIDAVYIVAFVFEFVFQFDPGGAAVDEGHHEPAGGHYREIVQDQQP